jgi:CheY-like chemotaxis protein
MSAPDDPAVLAGAHLLVVEDEMVVALSLEELLKTYDCTVTKAAHPARAIEYVHREVFDGALLDINLGGETAYPIAEVLNEYAIPFIFITGYSTTQVDAACRDRPILEKPIALEQLEHHMIAAFAPALG